MGEKAAVKIAGSAELARRIGRLSDELATSFLSAAVRLGANIVRDEASRRAPYRTGNLRRSLHTEVIEASRGDAAAKVGTNVEYARIQEFGGTVKHPGGTPYLFTSFAHHGGVTFLRKDGRYPRGTRFTRPHKIRIPARPYLYPALEAKRSAVVREIGVALRALLAKVMK